MVHCWADKGEFIEERFGFYSSECFNYLVEDDRCSCLLPDGHDGPHEWTPDKDIVITFKESTASAGG